MSDKFNLSRLFREHADGKSTEALVMKTEAILRQFDSMQDEYVSRAEKAEAELASMRKFHPRAMKLIGKQKNFVVVAEDEPYFCTVYELIRGHEKEIGRWSSEDEQKYQKAQSDYERPIDTP